MKLMNKIFAGFLAMCAVSCATEEEIEESEFRIEHISELDFSVEPTVDVRGGQYRGIDALEPILGAYEGSAVSTLLLTEPIACTDSATIVSSAATVKNNDWTMEFSVYDVSTLAPKTRFESVIYSPRTVSQTKVVTFTADGYIVSYIPASSKQIKGVTNVRHTICRKEVWEELSDINWPRQEYILR